jgi:hypothetical protein
MNDMPSFLALLGDAGASASAASNANELNRQFSTLLVAFQTLATKMGQTATVYTPAISAASGTITSVASGGRFMRLGKMCWVSINIVMTNNGTGGGALRATLPFGMVDPFNVIVGREYQSVGFVVTGQITNGPPNPAYLYITKYDNTYPGATANQIALSGWYETV